jgi:hypothetical protein
VIRHLVPASDCDDNFVGVGDASEGVAASVVVVEEAVDGGLKVDDGSEDAALQPPLAQRGEEALDGVEPRAVRPERPTRRMRDRGDIGGRADKPGVPQQRRD